MPFALITGASKGIGKAIALELAGRSKDVLLVARNRDLLQMLSSEITSRFNVRVGYLAIDLSLDESPSKVRDWCLQGNYDVDVLVNNAGYGLSGPFEKFGLENHLNMMKLNMDAVVQMTYLFLPMLKKHPKSHILNIASSAGLQATPFMGLYSASKSFVIYFSRALHFELSGTSVLVTCINPGATDTAFNERAQVGDKALKLAKKFAMSPEKLAGIAVSSMYRGKTELTAGFINKLGAFLVWLLPKKLVERSAAKIYE